MELVYLWVEEHKNIKEEGFNFSPRFECEFFPEYEEDANGKKKLKNDCKLLIKPQEHTSIFPKNINVTAIVGENGAGKSSLIEAIMLILFIRFNKDFCLIFDRGKGLEYIAKTNKNFQDIDYLGEGFSLNDIHINLISGLRRSNQFIRSIINKTEEYYQGNVSYEQSVLIKMAKVFSIKPNCFSVINKNFIFDKVKISLTKLNANNIKKELFDLSPDVLEIIDDVISKLESLYIKLLGTDVKQKRINSPKLIPNDISKLLIYNTLVALAKTFSNNVDEIEAILTILKKYSTEEPTIDKLTNDISTKISFENQEHKQYIQDILETINEFLKNNENNFTFIENNGFEKILSLKDEFHTIEEYIKKYFYLFKGFSEEYIEFQMINIDFITNQNPYISFFELSEGEKRLLSQLIEVQYELLKSSSAYLLLLDEPDISLHPNWNREFISLLLKTIHIPQPIHFIIASHSPFILSDIPKENIIFLEKDENGNCENVTKETKIETFGANIHTLLSHGFFMKDGLMGEFAKDKINKAITYLNQKTLSEDEIDYCENIISIIGEPILKRQLQKMLDSKRLSEIEQIKQEIKRLEDRMTLIWKNSK